MQIPDVSVVKEYIAVYRDALDEAEALYGDRIPVKLDVTCKTLKDQFKADLRKYMHFIAASDTSVNQKEADYMNAILSSGFYNDTIDDIIKSCGLLGLSSASGREQYKDEASVKSFGIAVCIDFFLKKDGKGDKARTLENIVNIFAFCGVGLASADGDYSEEEADAITKFVTRLEESGKKTLKLLESR